MKDKNKDVKNGGLPTENGHENQWSRGRKRDNNGLWSPCGGIAEIRLAHAHSHSAVVEAFVDVGPGHAAGSDHVPADFGLNAGVDGAQRGLTLRLHLFRDVVAGVAIPAGITAKSVRTWSVKSSNAKNREVKSFSSSRKMSQMARTGEENEGRDDNWWQ